MEAFDLAVIGSGPGGYVAAVRAGQLGGRVVVVEEEALGGTCLNWGCIPTKTMLTAVKFLHGLERGRDFGVRGEARLDWSELLKKKTRVVARLRKGIEVLFRGHSVTLVPGRARVVSAGVIEVEEKGGSSRRISAPNIILATGSVPTGLPGIPIDGDRVLDSKHALDLESPPASILIVGAGAIGCEFAHLLASWGTRVVIHLGVRVASLEKRPDGVSVTLEGGTRIDVEKVLVSVGRRPRVDDLGLEPTGIEVTGKGISVDERLRTTAEGFWAIGDVTGKNALAHVASAQAVVAAENALGGDRSMSYDVIPACVFTEPEVATVGLTEAMAEREGRTVSVGRFPWVASGRAQATGETTGFVKVLVEAASDRILGAQIVGPEATSLIAEVALAMRAGVPARRVADTVHAHPTYTEGVAEAVGAALGRAVHA
jgi:dihydrolipoamide dehydrogenase